MNKDSQELIVSEKLVSEDALSTLDRQFPLEGFYSEGEQWHIYFSKSPDLTKVAEALGVPEKEFRMATLATRNWNALWESNFKEVVIDNFCRIYADFHDSKGQAFDYEILINPKMSFGTGHHATTSMMIERMRELDFSGKTVLDFGTGTAVLGILAAKMGAKSVIGNDISIHAYENGLENIARNDLEGIKLFHGGMDALPKGWSYDLILANVNRTVLLKEADALLHSLSPGGELVLSGLLAADEDLVLQHYKGKGARLKNRKEKNDWICISVY
ncbi:MAG TPA: 50S ribosomal protein L11 methyltransferase [Saprospiraceae bacterium]|nr:50S ribosomal protein L11 methyltransferase [Saprospiraceae bacterium]